MNKFGFVLHPLAAHDVARKYPPLKYLPDSWVEGLLNRMGPQFVSQITDLRSATGATADGCFVGCMTTSRQLVQWPPERAYARILGAIDLAARWGARIVGLGAFTAVVGDKGITLADRAAVAITTGNSYTVYTAIEGARKAAELMGLRVAESRAAVLGATGSIGRACALLLAPEVGALSLVGRRPEALDAVAEEVLGETGARPETFTDVPAGVRDADIVLAVTSATEAIIGPDDVKPGAVVCDVARPRNVARAVAEERDDVLVIEGGAVAVPGEGFDFGFDFGFPPGLAYACMAETMILALEGRFEDYSLGPELQLGQVREMGALAVKHGFRLAGFRCFERTVPDEEIARKRERAGR
ncbi:MAG: shikimate dehydrogenase [Armatimonadetes bacterium]|nr:shikimate dehydrogenase [Armatimonadota bacterium]